MKLERTIHYGKIFLQFPLLKGIIDKKGWNLDDLGSNLKLSPISRKLIRQGYSVKKLRDKNKIKYFIKNSIEKEKK